MSRRRNAVDQEQDYKLAAQVSDSQVLAAQDKAQQVNPPQKASPQDGGVAMDVALESAEAGTLGVCPKADELQVVGQQMALAFKRAVAYHMQHGRMSREQAEAQALAPATDALTQHILNVDPRRVTYADLMKLHLRDPQLAAQKWESVKQCAAEALRTGEVHAQALAKSDEESLWKLAHFQATWEDLAQGSMPCTGLQKELLRQMVQYQMQHLKWMQILVERTERDILEEVGLNKKLRPPAVSQAQAVEQAAAMVERWQRMFLRAQRAFLDSRKQMAGPPLVGTQVLVQNAGQVNVAQQQVNLSRQEAD